MASGVPQLPRYDAFQITDAVYKTVNGHPVKASILTPHGLKPGKHPLLVRFHGGGLVEGVRLGDWFRPYILDFCAAESVIVATADYRFLPESTGYEILEDVADFWTWASRDLGEMIGNAQEGVEVDLDRVAVTGESAGGYLAAQSFLLPRLVPSTLKIRAVLLQAPILDLEWCEKPSRVPIFDFPMYPKETPELLLRHSPPDTVVTNVEPGLGMRLETAISMFQHGTFVQVLEGRLGRQPPAKSNDERASLWPMKNLMKSGGDFGKRPLALWVVHGWQDCLVPPEGTWKFCLYFKRLLPKSHLLMDFDDGDHGFDGEWAYNAPEVKRGWGFIRKHWFG